MYTREEAEGRRLKNPFDTITEGIGINRLTSNFAMAKLDGAFKGSDKEAVEMSRLKLLSFVYFNSVLICWHQLIFFIIIIFGVFQIPSKK